MLLTMPRISITQKILFTSICSLIILPPLVLGQDSPPATDIFIAPIVISSGEIRVGTPSNATDRNGYDNQPAFLRDGSGFLYSSFRDDNQTDVYYFDLNKSISYPVTSTPESEYSPTPLKGDTSFSTVRVEMDGTQRLWSMKMNGSSPRLILKEIKNVGYHGWANDSTVGLFIVGSPHYLQIVNRSTGKSETILENVGRSIHKVPGEDAISFVQKDSDDEWWIKKIDLVTSAISIITRTLPGIEDFAWTPNGHLLMASGNAIYKLHPSTDTNWLKIVEFHDPFLQDIKRIAVNPSADMILFVSNRPLPEQTSQCRYFIQEDNSYRIIHRESVISILASLPKSVWILVYTPIGKSAVWIEPVEGLVTEISVNYQSTIVKEGSGYRNTIPTDVPGFSDLQIISYTGKASYDTRNHPARQHAGWCMKASGTAIRRDS